MMNSEWETRGSDEVWTEAGLTDATATESNDDYSEELDAVAARIDRFSALEAGALALYYLIVEETDPELADLMINAFGQRSEAGFARWLDERQPQRLIPFEAYLESAADLDAEQKKFVADTIAESITHADQLRYMSVTLRPALAGSSGAEAAEATANSLSRELAQHRQALASSLMLSDLDGYLGALHEIGQGADRMDEAYTSSYPTV